VVVYVSICRVGGGLGSVLLYAVSIVLRLARFNALLDDASQPSFRAEFSSVCGAGGAICALGPLPPSCSSARWWTSPCSSHMAGGLLDAVVSRIPIARWPAVSVPPNWRALRPG